jgi:hypothetical protein
MRQCDNCKTKTDYPEITPGWITLKGTNKVITIYRDKVGNIEKHLSAHMDACSKKCLIELLLEAPGVPKGGKYGND